MRSAPAGRSNRVGDVGRRHERVPGLRHVRGSRVEQRLDRRLEGGVRGRLQQERPFRNGVMLPVKRSFCAGASK